MRRKGVEVLSDISASFKVGTVTGLIGPSGSGKSTLLRCLVGVQRFESGTLTILGHPSGTAELRGDIGYLSQNLAVYNDDGRRECQVLRLTLLFHKVRRDKSAW